MNRIAGFEWVGASLILKFLDDSVCVQQHISTGSVEQIKTMPQLNYRPDNTIASGAAGIGGISESPMSRTLRKSWCVLAVDDWIEETISGTKAYSKRALGRLLKKEYKQIHLPQIVMESINQI